MNCPKCKHTQRDNGTECERCGIIFTRYYDWLDSRKATNNETTPVAKETISFSSVLDIFIYIKPDENVLVVYGRLVLLIGMLLWSFKCVTSPIESNYAGESFMHLINLPFHEAGHIFFRPFGAFITSLGGTIAQLFLPLLCLVVLLVQTRDTFGASVCLWWFGENFFDIAPYVNDARSLTMPLVGGNVGHSSPYGFHDWEYILTESGLLQYDHFFAKLSIVLGTICFLLSFTWAIFLLVQQFKQSRQ